MKKIIKNQNTPLFNIWLRTQSNELSYTYNDLRGNEKNEVRESLIKEQGYICCYCGKKINNDYTSPIEHLKPKDENKYPELQLVYENFLLSCDGGKSNRIRSNPNRDPAYPITCDSAKGSQKIKVTPLDQDVEEKFTCDIYGNINFIDNDSKETLETLNINNEKFKKFRKDKIASYIYKNKMLKNNEELINTLSEVKKKSIKGEYIPYCFEIQNVIKRILKNKGISV